jgi:ankyrin repeat protein
MKLCSSLVTFMATILLIPSTTFAVVIFFLEDGIDDLSIISKLQKSDIPEDLSSFMGKSTSIAENLTDAELARNFCGPIERPKNSCVFSVALLERARAFGGGNFIKTETKFYRIAKLGGIERHTAYYSGGRTVSETFVLLSADEVLPRVLDSKEKLAARIAWERSRWPVLVGFLQNIRDNAIEVPAMKAHMPASDSFSFCEEIHDVVMLGNLAKVKAWLKDSPDLVSSKNTGSETPLHLAAQSNENMVKLLLSKGAEVDAKDDDGMTPLHMAAWKGEKAVVALLLSHGAEVNAGNKHGTTPLHYAADFDGYKDLADRKGVVELLVSHGAEVNAKDNIGLTPLHEAAFEGNKAVVELLLARGADVNAKNDKDSTPLHLAAEYGCKVVELLLAHGAQVTAKDKFGATPLHCAARGGHKDVAELLLSNKADINAKDGDGNTPLHRAASSGVGNVMNLLLFKNADLNARNNRGFTPLHGAAQFGRTIEIGLLLARGADVNARDNNGYTPLHYVPRGRPDVTELLSRHGGHE